MPNNRKEAMQRLIYLKRSEMVCILRDLKNVFTEKIKQCILFITGLYL